MCVAVPGQVREIQPGNMGVVDFEGARRRISLMLVPEVGVGDYVIVHAGFAIRQVDEQEAAETLQILRDMLRETPEAVS